MVFPLKPMDWTSHSLGRDSFDQRRPPARLA